MKIEAKSAAGYVAAIPEERRSHVQTLRKLVMKAVPDAKEGIVWGMLGYEIEGRPFVCIASHANYMSIYLCDLYVQPGLREKHAKALAGLKMGKSCINFSSVAELPLDTIEAILKEAPKVVVASGTMAAKSKAKSKTTKSAKAARPNPGSKRANAKRR